MSATAQQLSSDDRQLLRDSVRGVLERYWPAANAVTAAADPAAMRFIWQTLCEQGLGALGADPAAGEWRQILLVMEELGRAACPAPLLETALLNRVLALSANPAASLVQLAEASQAGTAAPAVAFGALDGDRSAGRAQYAAGVLNGQVNLVEGMSFATDLVVVLDGRIGLAASATTRRGDDCAAWIRGAGARLDTA